MTTQPAPDQTTRGQTTRGQTASEPTARDRIACDQAGRDRAARGAAPDQPAAAGAARFTACFSLVGGADPDVLARVANVLAKYGLVPRRCHAATAGPDGAGLQIELQIADADRDLADRLMAEFGRLICVERVLAADAGAARLTA